MNQPPVSTHTQRVPAPRKRQVINNVIRRHTDLRRPRLRRLLRQEPEIDIVALPLPRLPIPLPDIPIPHVIYQRRRDRPRIPKHHALRVIDQHRRRRLPRKLHRPRQRVLLQSSPRKQTMLAARRPVQPCNARVQRLRRRRRKRIRSRIQAIAQVRPIRRRLRIEVRQRKRVRPRSRGIPRRPAHRAPRIQLRHLPRRQRHRRSTTGVLQHPLLIQSRRRRRRHHLVLRQPLPFIVPKEEQLILDDEPTRIPTKNVPHQLRRTVRQPRTQLPLLVKVVIRHRIRGPVILIRCPVILVRPRLCHHRYLRARRSPLVRIRIARHYPELLDRVLRLPQHPEKRQPPQLIVIIHPVQRHIALVRALPVHGTRPAILRPRILRRRNIKHPRLQRQQIRHIPRLGRQRLDRRIIKRIAQRRIRIVQRLRTVSHLHHRPRAGRSQNKADRRRLIHQQLRLFLLAPKPSRLHRDHIPRRRNLRQLVLPLCVRRHMQRLPRRRIHQRDRRPRNHGTRRVLHHTPYRRGSSLRRTSSG